MLKVKTKDLKPIGELENAYKIGYEKHFNELWQAWFSLPIDDPKRHLCEPFNVIEITDGDEFIGTFRIIPQSTRLRKKEITYQLEHVIATLMDDVLFRYHQRSNFTTEQNIQYLLDQQTVRNWTKKQIDFVRFFHYKFENENGLLAPMYSIPKPFNVPYEWKYDTSSYPWELSLVKPSERVVGELRWGKNMGDFEEYVDPTKIVNRIFPLGAGEGVNQLGIESVNNGVPYLEDRESIQKYGLSAYVWVDRRFEDAESLKESGQSLLDEWKIPKVSVTAKGSDLSILPGYEFEKHRIGNLIRIVVPDRESVVVRIVSESKKDLTGAPQDIEFDLNNKLDDIATTQADMERKQRVNDAYSQGATNILNYDYQDNCDSEHPATIRFFIDDDVVNINTCELTFDTEEFRAYSQATEGGGSLVQTVTSGGGGSLVQSITSGGGGSLVQSITSEGGGGTQETSGAGGDHRHLMYTAIGFTDNSEPNTSVMLRAANGHMIHVNDGTSAGLTYYTEGSSGHHSHGVTFPNHTHQINLQLPNHTHPINIQLPDHTHPINIQLPNHTHDIKHGIFKLDTLPTSMEIRVDGNVVNFSSVNGERIDIIPYLRKENGRITRDRHEITMKPNGLARVNANLILRLFVQSHLGSVV